MTTEDTQALEVNSELHDRTLDGKPFHTLGTEKARVASAVCVRGAVNSGASEDRRPHPISIKALKANLDICTHVAIPYLHMSICRQRNTTCHQPFLLKSSRRWEH